MPPEYSQSGGAIIPKVPAATSTAPQSNTPQTPSGPTYSFSGGAIIPTVPLTNPTPPPSTITAPDLPTPKAPAIRENYVGSLADDAKRARTTVESAYQTQLDDINRRREEAQKNIDTLTEQQAVMLDQNVDPLLQPFRENLENSERSRLFINENFNANQALVNELDTLLTEGNQMIKGERNRFASRASINAGTSRAMEDVAARAGVIQAVMAARSSQISEAYRLIDRSVEAITADRKDRLQYYSTLMDFYENKKDAEGNKLISLDKDQKQYLEAQIGLLETDLKQADKNVQIIKEAMLDPDLAQAYGQAGVTLLDTPEQIGKKLADYGYQQEVINISNDMAAKGYAYLARGQSAPAGAQVVTVTDSKGKSKQYYGKLSTGSGSGSTSDQFDQARQFIDDNPDASRAELEMALRENTKLSDGDISSILDAAGVVKETSIAGQEALIATALVKSQGFMGDAQKAKEYLAGGGQLEVNGK